MDEEESDFQRDDDIRLELALQVIKDVIWRFEEASEGRRAMYEVLGCLIEDLVTSEGACPACINETVHMVFQGIGANVDEHLDNQGSTYH